MTELKPCPLCADPMTAGKFADMIQHVSQEGTCPLRGLSFPIEQLAAWNTRAVPRATGDDGELADLFWRIKEKMPVHHEELLDLADRITALRAEVERVTVEKAALWALLDDIDTLDDICRGDDAAFRERVRSYQRKRFAIMSGEEFDPLHDSARHRLAAEERGARLALEAAAKVAESLRCPEQADYRYALIVKEIEALGMRIATAIRQTDPAQIVKGQSDAE